jgi:hypothetical protein
MRHHEGNNNEIGWYRYISLSKIRIRSELRGRIRSKTGPDPQHWSQGNRLLKT